MEASCLVPGQPLSSSSPMSSPSSSLPATRSGKVRSCGVEYASTPSPGPTRGSFNTGASKYVGGRPGPLALAGAARGALAPDPGGLPGPLRTGAAAAGGTADATGAAASPGPCETGLVRAAGARAGTGAVRGLMRPRPPRDPIPPRPPGRPRPRGADSALARPIPLIIENSSSLLSDIQTPRPPAARPRPGAPAPPASLTSTSPDIWA